jgi:hypothetical protein
MFRSYSSPSRPIVRTEAGRLLFGCPQLGAELLDRPEGRQQV